MFGSMFIERFIFDLEMQIAVFSRRILTELWDKLRQWHEKRCKKYSEAIRQLKSGKRKMEEHLRSAEQKLRFIEEKKATTQNALASLLKPYAGAGIAGSNLDPYGDLPKRDELVVKIYALVAALEDRRQADRQTHLQI